MDFTCFFELQTANMLAIASHELSSFLGPGAPSKVIGIERFRACPEKETVEMDGILLQFVFPNYPLSALRF